MIFAFKIGFLEVTWVDLVDISLVAILLYQVYKLIRGSLAVNIFLGILALYLVYLIVRQQRWNCLQPFWGSLWALAYWL
jgi:diadenylate cyclase